MGTMDYIPSGKRLHNLHNYGKSPFFMGKSTSITLLFFGTVSKDSLAKGEGDAHAVGTLWHAIRGLDLMRRFFSHGLL